MRTQVINYYDPRNQMLKDLPILLQFLPAGADLTGARWPEGVPVPDGWMADGDSGRLQRAGQLSEVMTRYLWQAFSPSAAHNGLQVVL